MASKYISVQHNSSIATQVGQDRQLSEILLNRLPDPAFCVNSDAELMHVNDATCKLTGYSTQELRSMTLQDIESNFSYQNWSERWQQLKQQGVVAYQSGYRTKNGQILSLAISMHHADIDGKEISCVFAKHNNAAPKFRVDDCATKLIETNNHLRQEVDELKTKERELETSLCLLHSTLDSTANGIVALSFAGDIISCNQKFIDMWQVPDATLLSRKCPRCQTFFEEQVKDPEAFRKSIWEVPGDAEIESYDVIELKDGRIFAQYSQPQWVNGEIIGRVWSIWDISDFKLSAEAIASNLPSFGTLAETTRAIIFIIQDGRLRYANSVMEEVSGYKKAELLGDFTLERIIKHKQCNRAPLPQTSSPISQYQEIQIITKSGQERWLACSVGKIDYVGKPAELVMAIDITTCKHAEVEVRQALEQAKQLGKLKERFVSMLCHQFRTPLNIVSFSADLLKRHSSHWTEEKQLPYLAHIQTAVTQISQLLDEILFFGKLEAEKLNFEPKLIDLKQLCAEIVVQMQLASENKTQLKFIFKCDRSTYRLDDKLLQPILTNLLANAIKYSLPDSPVDLEVSCQEREVVFQVKDRGRGIPAIDLPKLFEPFHRGSNVDSTPGTGLGLAMVKTLVDLHGGRIFVSSQENAGSTFTIALPSVSNVRNDRSASIGAQTTHPAVAAN